MLEGQKIIRQVDHLHPGCRQHATTKEDTRKKPETPGGSRQVLIVPDRTAGHESARR